VIDLTGFESVAPGIWTSLPPGLRPAPYDRMASAYDRLVGNGVYNRLIWGCPKSEYRRAASQFLGTVTDGSILDFGCGSCVFTADAYRGNEARLTLFDRSLGMLERAARRVPNGQFLQGDALDPPFSPGSFAGIMGWGMLHIFGTESPYLAQMASLLRPGGRVAISTLVVTEPRPGNLVLRLLHRNGEAATPQGVGIVMAAFARYFELDKPERFGNMLFLTGRKPSP
jgi:ubiquinone/menaquinone biosynthesis C-methylase UbiE